jgi:hypothetical protein
LDSADSFSAIFPADNSNDSRQDKPYPIRGNQRNRPAIFPADDADDRRKRNPILSAKVCAICGLFFPLMTQMTAEQKNPDPIRENQRDLRASHFSH